MGHLASVQEVRQMIVSFIAMDCAMVLCGDGNALTCIRLRVECWGYTAGGRLVGRRRK